MSCVQPSSVSAWSDVQKREPATTAESVSSAQPVRLKAIESRRASASVRRSSSQKVGSTSWNMPRSCTRTSASLSACWMSAHSAAVVSGGAHERFSSPYTLASESSESTSRKHVPAISRWRGRAPRTASENLCGTVESSLSVNVDVTVKKFGSSRSSASIASHARSAKPSSGGSRLSSSASPSWISFCSKTWIASATLRIARLLAVLVMSALPTPSSKSRYEHSASAYRARIIGSPGAKSSAASNLRLESAYSRSASPARLTTPDA